MLISNHCTYCGVSIENIKKLRDSNKISSKSGRGFSLEIDRKEPNLEYTKENCCMTCYWCNNAKTDEFLPYEFKEIARGINQAWKCKGIDIQGFDEITFWDKIENDCK